MASLWNQKLEKLAEALADGKEPMEAARLAGYKGSSLKHNARKYAGRDDVKARVAELLAPGIKETERQLGINTEFVLTRAAEIARAKKPVSAIKVSDQVAALNLIAKIIGGMAPDKVEQNGKLVIEWAKPE